MTDAKSMATLGATDAAVLTALRVQSQSMPATTRDVADYMRRSPGLVRHALHRLKQSGLVEKHGQGAAGVYWTIAKERPRA